MPPPPAATRVRVTRLPVPSGRQRASDNRPCEHHLRRGTQVRAPIIRRQHSRSISTTRRRCARRSPPPRPRRSKQPARVQKPRPLSITSGPAPRTAIVLALLSDTARRPASPLPLPAPLTTRVRHSSLPAFLPGGTAARSSGRSGRARGSGRRGEGGA